MMIMVLSALAGTQPTLLRVSLGEEEGTKAVLVTHCTSGRQTCPIRLSTHVSFCFELEFASLSLCLTLLGSESLEPVKD